MSLIKKAKRESVWLKLGVSGPSGSGKTYSSLRLAKGLLGSLEKVVILDTENGSANLYSDLGDYSVLPMDPPYSPQRYIKGIQMCIKEGFECVIIDSTSHEWDGTGGCLDIQTKLGGRYQDWAKVTPMHKAFIDEILQSKVHIICTMRRKQDYSMVEKNGKMVVEKMGLKEIQRDGFEYELSANFSLEMNHTALASKDRTNLFSDGVPFMITEEIGEKLRDWSNGK